GLGPGPLLPRPPGAVSDTSRIEPAQVAGPGRGLPPAQVPRLGAPRYIGTFRGGAGGGRARARSSASPLRPRPRPRRLPRYRPEAGPGVIREDLGPNPDVPTSDKT